MTPHMDKHKALIERLAGIIDPTLFGRDAEALLDKWAGKKHDYAAAWRAEIRHGFNLGVRRNLARDQATAAINAVYEALKEPTPEMITTGDDAIDECVDFYDNAFGSGYTVEGRASRSTWQAMLSASALSSPLGEE